MSATGQGAAPSEPTASGPTSGWSDPDLARVGEVATAVAGLVFSASRQPSAESAMRRVMSAHKLARPVDLHRAVSTSGEVRDALLAALTIGESYFFREEGQLALLKDELLPAWRAAAEDAPRRIWSAGCASGEEPYSLAILLRELGWRSPVRILGTDIAEPRLEAARRGRYTKWALRGAEEARVARWFIRRGHHFFLDTEILRAVRFRALNLAANGYPSVETETAEQDLILCRNVLIYFDLATVADIAARLLRALRPGGWLIVGASDPPLADLVACEMVMTPTGAAYRQYDAPRARAKVERLTTPAIASRAVDASDAVRPAATRPVAPSPGALALPRVAVPAVRIEPPAEPLPTPAAAYARGDYEAAARLARAAVECDPEDVPAWVLWIRSEANAGRLVEAGEICARALDRHRVVPELHYLHGMLLVESGRGADGARDARRALYLDRTFVLGYMLLGDALARLGDRAGARRAFENADALLTPLPESAVVPASDGVPVARLRRMTAQRLQSFIDASDQ